MKTSERVKSWYRANCALAQDFHEMILAKNEEIQCIVPLRHKLTSESEQLARTRELHVLVCVRSHTRTCKRC